MTEIIINKIEDTVKIQTQIFALRPELEKGKQFVCEIKTYKPKRSLDANAYFHKLCHDIAAKLKTTLDEVKIRFNFEYGTRATADGDPIVIALPKKVDATKFYKYCQKINDFESPKGQEMTQYFLFKETHTLSSSEMSKLIDATISEAKELGIETKTTGEIAQIKSLWESVK